VEQVNLAVVNVAQASREAESSSGQTLQTASELAGLSRELLKVVQAESRA
jgi:methyl-accepting chemotaxis protein